MSIHIEAPDSPEFIRIKNKTSGLPANMIPVGSVGKVIGRANMESNSSPPLVAAYIIGHGERIFNTKDTELITEKEYFLGALGGQI